MSHRSEDVHSHRAPLVPSHLLSPVPLQSRLHRPANGRTLDSPLIKPRAVRLPSSAQCHPHGPQASRSTSPTDADTLGSWSVFLKDDPCQQPVLALRSAQAFHGFHHESAPCSVSKSLPERTDKKKETQQVSLCQARLHLCGAERGRKKIRRGGGGGQCGYSDRTMLLRVGRRTCTYITHTTQARTLIHNSHRHDTHATEQVHTLHRQTCTHRTYILFSARGHAGAQQLEGLKAQLLRKADFPVMPLRLRWGQRGTVRGDGRRPTGEL